MSYSNLTHTLSPTRPRYILIEPKELKFALGEMEPLFCSICILDFAEKKRVSENFYFHMNNDAVMMLLPPDVRIVASVK